MSTAPAPKQHADQEVVHVVDDDPALREALDSLFRSVGYSVRTFGNAAEFMSSGSARSSGCLVLDVRLPGLRVVSRGVV